jgi:hypothetical protein
VELSSQQNADVANELLVARAEAEEIQKASSEQIARLTREVNANAGRVLGEFKTRLGYEVAKRVSYIPSTDSVPEKDEGRLFLFQLHQLLDLLKSNGVDAQPVQGQV